MRKSRPPGRDFSLLHRCLCSFHVICHYKEDSLLPLIDENSDYRPAEIPKLEEALVDVRGETLLLAVANDRDAVDQTLNG